MTIEEYNICVDKFSDGIYRFALKSTKNPEKAKDVVQDTFEKLWTKIENVSFSKAKSYLFTTAYHTFIDQTRKEKRRNEYEKENIPQPSYESQYTDLSEILNKAIDQLPEIQRSVILLRDYEGYSYDEIAEITELNESQVKVYIYRGRLFLKKYIGSLERVI